MLKPINIGPLQIDDPIVLAPMSGVTDMPFRRLVKRAGAGLVVSEMIASRAMVHAARKTLKMATHCADEYPISVQLAGCEPDVMAEAARINEDFGATIIDINMGCPVKKVVKTGSGSGIGTGGWQMAPLVPTEIEPFFIPKTDKTSIIVMPVIITSV